MSAAIIHNKERGRGRGQGPAHPSAPIRQGRLRRHSVIPGFGISLGLTITYLSLIVLIPLAAMIIFAANSGWESFVVNAFSRRALKAYQLSFGAAAVAGFINMIFGLLVAWVLVRYEFPGRRFIDALVDLPFALPTAVAGIALTALYASNGWIGQYLEPLGIKVAFTQTGIVIALIFIGLPFVVRMVEPVLADLGRDVEEAAASLGATRAQIFFRVVLPSITPALLTGFAMVFARGLGEYGSVIFIAGNRPFVSEIVPLLIIIELEQYDYAGATAIACVTLAASFTALLFINLIQAYSRKRMEG